MSFNEKLSYTEHVVVSPTTVFAIGFADYGLPSDTINVFVDDVLATDAGYTVTRKNSMVVELQPAVASGVVRLQRATNLDASFYRFTAGAKFVAANIDANFNQILHSQQETNDGFDKLVHDTGVRDASLRAEWNAYQFSVNYALDQERTARIAGDVNGINNANNFTRTYVDNLLSNIIVGSELQGVTDGLVQTFSGRTQLQKNQDIISSADAATPDAAATLAYTKRAKFLALTNSKLVVPLGAPVLPAMEWAQYVMTNTSSEFSVAFANGMHVVSGYQNVYGSLNLTSENIPTRPKITAYEFTNLSANLCRVHVRLATAIPAYVGVGYAIGIQNPKGDGGTSSTAGAHIVLGIDEDRLGITFEMTSYGNTTLTNSTTLDNTVSLGIAANEMIIPSACLRVSGWDGAAIEGFLNVMRGGRLSIRNLAISFDGIKSEQDILFANEGKIALPDYVVVAGTGDKVLRAAYGGNIYAYRSCFGCGTTGAEIWQGLSECNLSMVRCSLNGGTDSAITATEGAQARVIQTILSSANIALRPTYDSSSVACITSRIHNCATAVTGTRGVCQINTDVSINNVTTFASISNARVSGNPTMNNVTTLPAVNQYLPQGGYWQRDLAPIAYPSGEVYVGTFKPVMDFPSIEPHSYQDLTATCTGARINDRVYYSRNGAAEVNQAIIYMAFVSANNTVTLRAFNISNSAVDKTAFTANLQIHRTN